MSNLSEVINGANFHYGFNYEFVPDRFNNPHSAVNFFLGYFLIPPGIYLSTYRNYSLIIWTKKQSIDSTNFITFLQNTSKSTLFSAEIYNNSTLFYSCAENNKSFENYMIKNYYSNKFTIINYGKTSSFLILQIKTFDKLNILQEKRTRTNFQGSVLQQGVGCYNRSRNGQSMCHLVEFFKDYKRKI